MLIFCSVKIVVCNAYANSCFIFFVNNVLMYVKCSVVVSLLRHRANSPLPYKESQVNAYNDVRCHFI